MIEVTGDLFTQECDAICITTNGFIKSNGEAVMGRGVAKQAAEKWPVLPRLLAENICNAGNVPHVLCTVSGRTIVSFPVKSRDELCAADKGNVVTHWRNKVSVGDEVPGFACVARLDLIEMSAKRLRQIADRFSLEKIALPRPGCGAGELKWEQVKPILESILDDRFVVVSLPGEPL